MPIQLYSATQSQGLLLKINASRQKTPCVVLSLFLLCYHYHSYCSRRLEQKTWTPVHPVLSPTIFATYSCWVTFAKLGGGKPKTTFFFTDSKGRLGWINKMIWHSVLEWGQNAGVFLPLLTFLCTFSLFVFLSPSVLPFIQYFTHGLHLLCYIQRLILASCKGCISGKIVFDSYLYTRSSEVILCLCLQKFCFHFMLDSSLSCHIPVRKQNQELMTYYFYDLDMNGMNLVLQESD